MIIKHTANKHAGAPNLRACALRRQGSVQPHWVVRSPWRRHSSHICLFLICTKSLLPQRVLWPSHVRFFAAPWTIARQAPLSMGVSRQESWSGLPFPPPGDLPGPGMEPRSPALAGGFSTTATPVKPSNSYSGAS